MLKIFNLLVCIFLLAPFKLFCAQQNFTEIETQARLAGDTYLDAVDIKGSLQKKGQVLVHQATIKGTQVSYFLSQLNDVQTIAIRGTANVENVMLDLNVALQPDAELNIKLHQGFASGARTVYENIKPYLNAEQPIHITGHSLGGAIAVVLAMYLKKDDFDVQKIITFGQPKVTNVNGANKFVDLPLLRIVTPEDIVPLVPPISPMQIKNLDIYWHIGVEVILMGNGQYAETSGVKSALRATKFTSSIPGEKNLTAHKMTTYISLLEELQVKAVEIPYKSEISFFGMSLN